MRCPSSLRWTAWSDSMFALFRSTLIIRLRTIRCNGPFVFYLNFFLWLFSINKKKIQNLFIHCRRKPSSLCDDGWRGFCCFELIRFWCRCINIIIIDVYTFGITFVDGQKRTRCVCVPSARLTDTNRYCGRHHVFFSIIYISNINYYLCFATKCVSILSLTSRVQTFLLKIW